MDYPTCLAFAIPISAFIFTVGNVAIKFKRNSPSLSSKGSQNNSFIGRREFDAVTGGIAQELKLTREEFVRGIKDVKEQIRGLKS